MQKNSEQVLMNKTDTLNEVEDLITAFKSDSLQPSIDADIEFSTTFNVLEQCKCYGKLEQNRTQPTYQLDYSSQYSTGIVRYPPPPHVDSHWCYRPEVNTQSRIPFGGHTRGRLRRKK